MAGKALFFVGVERKCGTTMISRSMAQFLASAARKQTLWISRTEENRIYGPEDLSGVCLREAGLDYLKKARWKGNMEAAKERFSWICVDEGALPRAMNACSALRQTEKVIWVAEQSHRCLLRTEELLQRVKTEQDGSAEEGEIPKPDLLLINRYRENDPFTLAYCRQRLAPWPWLPCLAVADSQRGREAEWQDMTLLELRDRAFRRDISAVRKELEYEL